MVATDKCGIKCADLMQCKLSTKTEIMERWLREYLQREADGLSQKKSDTLESWLEYTKALISLDGQTGVNRVLVHDVLFQFWQDSGNELLQEKLRPDTLVWLFAETVAKLELQDILHSKLLQIVPREESFLFLVRSLSMSQPKFLAGFVRAFLKPAMPDVVQKTLLQLVQKYENLIKDPKDQHAILTAIFDFVIFMSKCCSHAETSSKTSEALECLRVVLSGRWREHAQLSSMPLHETQLPNSRTLLQYTYQEMESTLVTHNTSTLSEPFWAAALAEAEDALQRLGGRESNIKDCAFDGVLWHEFVALEDLEQGQLALHMIGSLSQNESTRASTCGKDFLEFLKRLFGAMTNIATAINVVSYVLLSDKFSQYRQWIDEAFSRQDIVQKELLGFSNRIVPVDRSRESHEAIENELKSFFPLLLISPAISIRRIVHDALFHKGKSQTIARLLSSLGPASRYCTPTSSRSVVEESCIQFLFSGPGQSVIDRCMEEIVCFFLELISTSRRGTPTMAPEVLAEDILLPMFNEENGTASVRLGLHLIRSTAHSFNRFPHEVRIALLVSVCQSIDFEFDATHGRAPDKVVCKLAISTVQELLPEVKTFCSRGKEGFLHSESIERLLQDCASCLPWHLQLWFLPILPEQPFTGLTFPDPLLPYTLQTLVEGKSLPFGQAVDVLGALIAFCSVARNNAIAFKACITEKINVDFKVKLTYESVPKHTCLAVRALAANFTEAVSLLLRKALFNSALLVATTNALEKSSAEQVSYTLDYCLDALLLFHSLERMISKGAGPKENPALHRVDMETWESKGTVAKLDFLFRCMMFSVERKKGTSQILLDNIATYMHERSQKTVHNRQRIGKACFLSSCQMARYIKQHSTYHFASFSMLALRLYSELMDREPAGETERWIEGIKASYSDILHASLPTANI